MANVLYLTHRLPYPPNKGDKLRTYHLLKYLSSRHKVFLGTFVDDPADYAHVPVVRGMCEDLFVAGLTPATAKLRSLIGLATGEALTVPYYRHAGLRAWVRTVIRESHIDAALVFSSTMSQYADELPDIPNLAVFDDVDSVKWGHYAEHHRWPLSWLYRRESRYLLEFERQSAVRATCTFFVTDNEAGLFRSLAPEVGNRVAHVCNGVDADFFAPAEGGVSPYATGEQAVVFTGAMDYWPNADAALWFAAEVVPRLREAWPKVRFHVVGRSPTPAVQALASEHVAISGTVPDVRPWLRHAALVVAPLRMARGIQNKILEAMAMGKAVVASAACAGALDAEPGREFLTAADADEFARQIGGLLADPERAAAIGAAAREAVLARYSWAAHLAGFDRYLPAAESAQPRVTEPG